MDTVQPFSRIWSGVNLLQNERIAPREIATNHAQILFVFLLGLSLFLNFATLTQDSLWIDEGYTLESARHSFQHIWTVPFDSHPPLHFIAVKVFGVFGENAWSVRAPSALFASLALIPIFGLSRRLIGSVGALVTVASLAVSFTFLVYANNGRNYALLLFCLMWAVWALYEIASRFVSGAGLRASDVRPWMLVYGLASLAALYTHNTAILYLFIANLAACGFALLSHPRRIVPVTLRLAAVNAAPIVLWLPWLAVMLSTSGLFNWLEHMTPRDALVTLAATIGPNQVSAPLVLLYFLAVGAGLALATLRLNWTGVIIVLHVVLFPLFIWSIGLVYKPVYMERIILPAMLGGALAIGLCAAQARRRSLAVGLPAIALLVSIISAGQYLTRGPADSNVGAHLIQDWEPAVSDHAGSSTAYILCDTFTWPTAAYYAGDMPVYVNQRDGLLLLSGETWRAYYGRPASTRIVNGGHGPQDWPAALLAPWPDRAAGHDKLVLLTPDIICDKGEADRIRAKLTANGFARMGPQSYRGVTADPWVRTN